MKLLTFILVLSLSTFVQAEEPAELQTGEFQGMIVDLDGPEHDGGFDPEIPTKGKCTVTIEKTEEGFTAKTSIVKNTVYKLQLLEFSEGEIYRGDSDNKKLPTIMIEADRYEGEPRGLLILDYDEEGNPIESSLKGNCFLQLT